jgi:hypothetical protein
MRNVDLLPLEYLFRAEVFKFLGKEGKIIEELIRNFWGGGTQDSV